MNIRPKTVVTMHVNANCPSHSRTDVTVRDTALIIDEPAERGGTNAGPAPTEVMVASLAGCTNTILNKCAHAHGVEVHALSIIIDAKFDRRGVTLQEEIDLPFPEMLLKITLTTPANAAAIEQVKTDLARFCPVSKVIRQAGTIINEEWTITRP